ncbi:MAG: flavin reductase family protein [Chitinispirillaceae bacterium]|jgi:flavin reductase (DIM6/NTAB) family NADH-FMN oxidoreductase RutF
MKEIPLSKTFQLIELGPVVLVTTVNNGRANIMTMSWHMMMEFEPPLISCIVSPANYSFKGLCATKECVISIPTVDLATKVVEIGNCSGKDIDKFDTFCLTSLLAKKVLAPLVRECLHNIECRVVDSSKVKKYGLFILEGVKAWTDAERKERRTIHANGDGTFVVDGRTINLKEKMVKWTALCNS